MHLHEEQGVIEILLYESYKNIYFTEDQKINQQNAQINSGLILLLITHSNMFRPLS